MNDYISSGKNMQQVGGFLDRLRKILGDRVISKKTIQKIIMDKVGLLIPEKELLIKNNTLKIRTSPIVRSEVFLKKAELISFFSQTPETKHINNIV